MFSFTIKNASICFGSLDLVKMYEIKYIIFSTLTPFKNRKINSDISYRKIVPIKQINMVALEG